MGQIIEFPLHRVRRHLGCDLCGHPGSVRIRIEESVCNFCDRKKTVYHCHACDSKHSECRGCAGMFAGTDEIL